MKNENFTAPNIGGLFSTANVTTSNTTTRAVVDDFNYWYIFGPMFAVFVAVILIPICCVNKDGKFKFFKTGCCRKNDDKYAMMGNDFLKK